MKIVRGDQESIIQRRIDLWLETHKYPPNYTIPGKPRWMDLFKGRDDERLMFKTLLMAKYTGVVGGLMSITDIMLVTQSKTVGSAFQRLAYWNIPIIGGGIAYTVSVAVIASVRDKKDSSLTHFLGGMAAGAVCGAARNSITFGVLTGTALGIYGCLNKECIQQAHDLWPDGKTHNKKFGWALTHKQDYSRMEDRPGYWVREAPSSTPGKC